MALQALPEWGAIGPNTEAAKALLSVFGTTVTLPDNTTIKMIVRPYVETQKSNEKNTQRYRYAGYVPNDVEYYGTLTEEQSITSGSRTYWASSIEKMVNGWLEVKLTVRGS